MLGNIILTWLNTVNDQMISVVQCQFIDDSKAKLTNTIAEHCHL